MEFHWRHDGALVTPNTRPGVSIQSEKLNDVSRCTKRKFNPIPRGNKNAIKSDFSVFQGHFFFSDCPP